MTKEERDELDELLMIAYRAAFKASTMYIRGECEHRDEIDRLIGAEKRFMEARKRLGAPE